MIFSRKVGWIFTRKYSERKQIALSPRPRTIMSVFEKNYCKLHHAELCGYLHKFEKIWMQSVIDYSKTRLSHESQSFFVSIFSRCKRIHKVCKVEYPLLRE